MLMRRLALVALALVSTGACASSSEDADDCGDRPIPASIAPKVASFRVVINELQEPEGCGADFKRRLVYAAPPQSGTDVLAAFGAALARDAWEPTTCVTARERCFVRDGWFLAATLPDSTVGEGPQVLAVLQRR